jgi:hypothetical protein
MIGQTLLRRSLAQSRYGAQVVSASNRSFAGGGNKPKPIDPKTTDYDILFVGKHSFFAHLPSSKSFCGTDCYLLSSRKELSGVEVVNATNICARNLANLII